MKSLEMFNMSCQRCVRDRGRALRAPQITVPNPQAPNFPMPFVYILRCRDGSLYTGITTDVPRRLQQHQTGRASKYTRARLPVTLSWTRQVHSWSQALKEEHRIKTLTRDQKEALLHAEQAQDSETR
jgi:putative endonuclease